MMKIMKDMTFRMKLAFIATIGLFVVGIIGILAILAIIVYAFLSMPELTFAILITILLIILIIGVFKIGATTLVDGIREKSWLNVIWGIICILAPIILVVSIVPTDNYTDWENTTVQLLSPIEEEYIIDNENEYEYKVLEYSETGEEIENYKTIEKDENTVVEMLEINTDVALVYIFTREAKSVLGNKTGAVQTKYIFCVPE